MIADIVGALAEEPPAPVDYTPWIPAIVGVLAAIIAGTFAILNRRGGERARRQPTWAELATDNRLLREELSTASVELRAARRDLVAADRIEGDLTDLRREFEEHVERVEDRDRVLGNVLASAHEQWPAGHPGPTFDHILDLDMIGDTLPPQWRRNTPRA
jgi:hypothetical protein